ncbi:MAG: glutamate--cysteine ligase [Pseudomonadota bacterium]
MAKHSPMIPFHTLSQRALDAGAGKHLTAIRRGIEKEALRTNSLGDIADDDHPACLGSPLTHPSITTDYSEALLELITGAYCHTHEVLYELRQLHAWVDHCIGDQTLWPGSMPCRLDGNESVPIARYGNSNSGMMKHVYRRGLDWRYGRIMQSIAGIHYNYSLPDSWWESLYEASDKSQSLQDFTSAGYLALIRNFRRHAWLLLYLFGASPALDKSFVDAREHKLQPLKNSPETLHAPYATCLRMTDLGYKSEAQNSIWVCYNHLETYIQTLRNALTIEYPPYRQIGTKVNGEYRQLNTRLLQIENEYYSEIRPKRTPKAGERPLVALERYGIEYIEVRLLDLNPELPMGLDETQIHFLDCFLTHCLLQESPVMPEDECQRASDNLYSVAERGRDPELSLRLAGNELNSPLQAAVPLLESMRTTAELLDSESQTQLYSRALEAQLAKAKQPHKLPSAAQLSGLVSRRESYREMMLRLGDEHRSDYRSYIDETTSEQFMALSEQSIKAQRDIEAADDISFDEFLSRYFADDI